MRMPLFYRENKIKALYERMVGSRWQCIMILYQTEVALRIISRSQYWLIVCKPSFCKTNLVLVTETSKNIKKEILKHQENVNLTAGTILKMYFWFWVVALQARFSKLVSIVDCIQFAEGSSAHNIILGFTLLSPSLLLYDLDAHVSHAHNFWDSRPMFLIWNPDLIEAWYAQCVKLHLCNIAFN